MIKVTENADLKKMTTFGLPAGCGSLVEYTTLDDLRNIYMLGHFEGEHLFLGGGSNLLFTRGRFDGTVFHCADRSVEWHHTDTVTPLMICGAGLPLDEACRIAAEEGLWGLENLSGIPGSTGGAAVQNAGAYGVEAKDVVEWIETFDIRNSHVERMMVDDCRYGYRTSVFKDPQLRGNLIITRVAFRLSRDTRPVLTYRGLTDRLVPGEVLTPAMLRATVLEVRAAKLPDHALTGSAGSFFKNPVVSQQAYAAICAKSDMEPSGHLLDDGTVKLSAAWLIDHAGCKTLTCGGASLWPSQPLVIVNATGTATGADVTGLCRMVIERVESVFGLRLTPEVIFV